jgi:hypothetical protein
MRSINLCRNEPVITEFHNGKRTNKDIKEYQRKYREQKKKEQFPKVFIAIIKN